METVTLMTSLAFWPEVLSVTVPMPPGWQRLAMLQFVKSQVAVSALVVDVSPIMATIRDSKKKTNLVLERISPRFHPTNFRTRIRTRL